MQLSSAEKALYIKLVYYGPGVSGKTTNLETIHRITDPDRRQALVSLKTEADRTLFFDLLPFDLGTLFGLNIRVKLFTVPGQVQYDTTRKQVLAGADGVVFVADSSPKQRDNNKNMIRYLKANLTANGLDPESIPLIFQYNKRDLPDAMPMEQMNGDLNWRGVPSFESVATVGTGVMECFREIATLTLEHVSSKAAFGNAPVDISSLRAKVSAQFETFLRHQDEMVSKAQSEGTIHNQEKALANSEDGRHREVLGLDSLLSEAVQANLAMSEQLASGPNKDELFERARCERGALTRFVGHLMQPSNAQRVLQNMLTCATEGTGASIASVLLKPQGTDPLRQAAIVGREADPLNSIVNPGIGSAASGVLQRNEVFICHDIAGELLFGKVDPSVQGLRSVMAFPFGAELGIAGLLLYASQNDTDLESDDLEFVGLVTNLATFALKSFAVAKS